MKLVQIQIGRLSPGGRASQVEAKEPDGRRWFELAAEPKEQCRELLSVARLRRVQAG